MHHPLKRAVVLLLLVAAPWASADIAAGHSPIQPLGFTQLPGTISSPSARCQLAPDEVYLPRQGQVALPAFVSLSSVETRRWYKSQLQRLPELLDTQCDLEQQARQAWSLRNTFRTAARYAMRDQHTATLLHIEQANRTWAQTLQRYGARHQGDALWYAIIGSAQRSNPMVDQAVAEEAAGQP